MRTFTTFASGDARRQLDILVDQEASAGAYQQAMTSLGRQLAVEVVAKNPSIKRSTVCVACTVEDADYLARGLLDGLAETGVDSSHLRLVCFWNERVRRFNGDDHDSFDVAPIVKQYREEVDISNAVIVVVKSIISGACVVKTNLATLIDQVLPQRVIVAAPVMLEGAEGRLAAEFPSSTSGRFEYFTFAIDTERDQDDNVVPGIGGSVYARLGFEDKTSYVPELVKQRRRDLAHV
jgi:hypothetical protein